MEKLHSSLIDRPFLACPSCGSPHYKPQAWEDEGVRRYKCDNCLKIFRGKYDKMANDLFVMMSNNKYSGVVDRVEGRVAELFAARHDSPMWPEHLGEMDDFERMYHAPIRHSYYYTTILLIQTLRTLKSIS